jgi:hypothetical protein
MENEKRVCLSQERKELMLAKITARPPLPASVRNRAVRRFREWDASMIRRYGPLYHRRMGYTVH